MTQPVIAEKLLRIDASFRAAGIDHAFGGAIALGYWTREPRGTRDIDVNIFTPSSAPEVALAALPSGVKRDERTAELVRRDGQIRLWWEDTPVDLFFNNLPIHDDAARHRRVVPFEGVDIPILGPLELALFKVMFDRTQDWADIEAMLRAKTLDVDALRTLIDELLGDDDPRLTRLDDSIRRAGD